MDPTQLVYVDVQRYLTELLSNPVSTAPIDERRIECIDIHVSENLKDEQRAELISQAYRLLAVIAQEPSPLTSLVSRLIKPRSCTFETITGIVGLEFDFSAGLQVASAPINVLTLEVLEKAAETPSQIWSIASRTNTIEAWITLWLSTQDTAVAQKAGIVLTKFLVGGKPTWSSPSDDNLMARRVFRDAQIYELYFSFCKGDRLGRHQRSLAQARLLDLLVSIDCESSPIRTSQFPDIERRYGVHEHGGLLEFAFCHMIDLEDDDLMLATYIGVCKTYLERSATLGAYPLLFLQKHDGRHDSCMSYFLHPRPSDASWLLSESASYIATYCTHYSDDVLGNAELCTTLLAVLNKAFVAASKSDWESGKLLKHHLFVTAHLPRLLHIDDSGKFPRPLYQIPDSTSNANVMNALAHIFCPGDSETEKAAARVSYFNYVKQNPLYWTHVVQIADTIALTDAALAALDLMRRFISTKWTAMPHEPAPSNRHITMPSETELATRLNSGQPLPMSGLEVLVFEAQTGPMFLDYLFQPPKVFSNVVGGGRGDTTNAAYKVAAAKYDVLLAVHEQLRREQPRPEITTMLEVLTRKIALGPMGGASQAGGHVGTMEK